MILITTPIIANNTDITISSTAEAARGGAKLNIPRSTPKPSLNEKTSPNLNKTPASSSNSTNKPAGDSKAVSGNGNEYTPSKNAKDLPSNAPTAKSNTATNSATSSTANRTGTGFGNTLRNIGLFAGGMMLGGLIGSMLGDFGGGLFSDILGLLFNLAIIYAVYRGGRYLWNRLRGNNNSSAKTEYKTEDFRQPIDITPPQISNSQSAMGIDYDPKRTADHYRNL
ncbi:MAG: hypothetical protein IJ563_09880 [Selenomonadaceae bacterium]|nr:hypothetical protein [Selenomonadaceae bacterium]MBR1859351.1 hypothetical protein [Selenomonadaceae bacterium]